MTKEQFEKQFAVMDKVGAPTWALYLAKIVYNCTHPSKEPTELMPGNFTIGVDLASGQDSSIIVDRCSCGQVLRMYHPNAKDMSPTPACPKCSTEPVAKPEGCGKSLGGI